MTFMSWLGRTYAKLRGKEEEYERKKKVREALSSGKPVVAGYEFKIFPNQRYPGAEFCMNRDTYDNVLTATVYILGERFPEYMSVDAQGVLVRPDELMPKLKRKILKEHPDIVL